MSAQSKRKFVIFDIMVFVAATGLGLGAFPWLEPDFHWQWIADIVLEISNGNRSFFVLSDLFDAVSIVLLPCSATWTTALLLLRFRQPRPRLRRLRRQPGFVACSMAALSMAGSAAIVFAITTFAGTDPKLDLFLVWVYLGSAISGSAVLVSWGALALSGHWSPEKDWVDRAGRLMGVFWIALAPVRDYEYIKCGFLL